MTRWIERLVLVLVGAAAGAAGVGGFAAPEQTSGSAPEGVRSAPELRPETPPPTSPSAAPTECGEALAPLRLELAVLRQQLATLGGARAEWSPEDLARLGPEPIQRWLRSEELEGAELVTLDCDEYPCLALFRYAAGAPASSAVLNPLAESFRGWREEGNPTVHVLAGEQGAWGALSLGALGDGEEVTARLPVRMKELFAAWTDE